MAKHDGRKLDHKSLETLRLIAVRRVVEDQEKPSVEVPVGDFFGLNLGQYSLYQSAFLNCASVRALNCYFAMPFRKSARITVSNESDQPCRSLYYYIDWQKHPTLPADTAFACRMLTQLPVGNSCLATGWAPSLKLSNLLSTHWKVP